MSRIATVCWRSGNALFHIEQLIQLVFFAQGRIHVLPALVLSFLQHAVGGSADTVARRAANLCLRTSRHPGRKKDRPTRYTDTPVEKKHEGEDD